jgi:predicted ferric reductase
MNTRSVSDELDELASPRSLGWAIAGVAFGAVIALLLLPDFGPVLAGSLMAPQPRTWWYLSRSSGLVASALLCMSMVLGLLLSTKLSKEWPGAVTTFALHEHASILGLAFSVFHGVVLLGDRHTPFTASELVLPFGAAYRPLALGLGQLALYGSALLVGTFYVRSRIGHRAWKVIHSASFAVFVLALVHGIAASTDHAATLVSMIPGAGVIFLAIYGGATRVLAAWPGRGAGGDSAS